MTHLRRSVLIRVCFQSKYGAALLARLTALASIVLFAGLLPRMTRAAENPSGVLEEKEGKVEIARKGSTAWNPAEINGKLQLGDRLRTGSRSRATLRWSELSTVRVSELTSMEIQPPAKPGDKPQLDLRSGA